LQPILATCSAAGTPAVPPPRTIKSKVSIYVYYIILAILF
jgi:hypothetical protein